MVRSRNALPLAVVICLLAATTASASTVQDEISEFPLPDPPSELIDLPGGPDPLTDEQSEALTDSFVSGRDAWGLAPRAKEIRDALDRDSLDIDYEVAPFPVFDDERDKVSELMRRAGVAQDTANALAEIEGYGGASFDVETGTLHVAVVPGSEAAERAKSHRAESVEYVDARVSVSDYEEFTKRYRAKERSNAGNSPAFDLRLGRIVVYTDQPGPELDDLAADLRVSGKPTGGVQDFVVETGTPFNGQPVETSCDRRVGCGPARPGGAIYERWSNGAIEACTIGVTVRRIGSHPDWGLLTAAHCDVTPGTQFEIGVGRNRYAYPSNPAPNPLYGTQDAKKYNTYADLMVVDVDANYSAGIGTEHSMLPYAAWHPGVNVSVPVQGTAAPVFQMPICQLSINREPATCGSITNTYWNGGGWTGQIIAWLPVDTLSGDSGGPTFTANPPYRVVGITRALVVSDPNYYISTPISQLTGMGWEVLQAGMYTGSPGRHNFVYGFYDSGLHREPDIDGYNYWYGQIGSNCPTRSRDMGWQILTGPEITNSLPISHSNPLILNAQIVARLQRLYFGLLGRVPDNGGLTYWMNHIASAPDVPTREARWRDAVYGFLFSNEFNVRLLSGTQGEHAVC